MTKSTSLPVLLIATLFVSILGLAAPAGAAETVHTCFGEEATIVGTEGRDYIRGTRGRDVIVGLAGNDVIRGLGGDDLICGNEGHDRIWGQAGNDMINGGYGRDRIQAGAGDDLVKGMQARDRIWDGPGNDIVQAGGGNDIMIEGTGVNQLLGGVGVDTLRHTSDGRTCPGCGPSHVWRAEKFVDLNDTGNEAPPVIQSSLSVECEDAVPTTCVVTKTHGSLLPALVIETTEQLHLEYSHRPLREAGQIDVFVFDEDVVIPPMQPGETVTITVVIEDISSRVWAELPDSDWDFLQAWMKM